MSLNPNREKVGGDHLETSGVWPDQIEMKSRRKDQESERKRERETGDGGVR